MDYMLGQRVILNCNEIGTIVKPERNDMPNDDEHLWVYSPSKEFASYYASHNVKPLPNGQL